MKKLANIGIQITSFVPAGIIVILALTLSMVFAEWHGFFIACIGLIAGSLLQYRVEKKCALVWKKGFITIYPYNALVAIAVVALSTFLTETLILGILLGLGCFLAGGRCVASVYNFWS